MVLYCAGSPLKSALRSVFHPWFSSSSFSIVIGYYNASMVHQNMHLRVNGCRWFECLEIFTQPCTNVWLLIMRTCCDFESFLKLDFISSVKVYLCCVVSFWRCEVDPPLWSGNVLFTAEETLSWKSSKMWELFSTTISTMRHNAENDELNFLLLLDWCDFLKPSSRLPTSPASLASNSP